MTLERNQALSRRAGQAMMSCDKCAKVIVDLGVETTKYEREAIRLEARHDADTKAINQLVAGGYLRGVIEGMRRFAHWRDGVEEVGTCGTTLKKAIADAMNQEIAGNETQIKSYADPVHLWCFIQRDAYEVSGKGDAVFLVRAATAAEAATWLTEHLVEMHPGMVAPPKDLKRWGGRWDSVAMFNGWAYIWRGIDQDSPMQDHTQYEYTHTDLGTDAVLALPGTCVVSISGEFDPTTFENLLE